MRHYRHGAHTKTDLKAHIVWIPKYRKKVLIGPVAVRVRDLIRQIAMEHELHIISGKVARDHVHVFVSYRPHQDLSTIVQFFDAYAQVLREGCFTRSRVSTMMPTSFYPLPLQ